MYLVLMYTAPGHKSRFAVRKYSTSLANVLFSNALEQSKLSSNYRYLQPLKTTRLLHKAT